MKKLNFIPILLVALLVTGLFSCKKEEKPVTPVKSYDVDVWFEKNSFSSFVSLPTETFKPDEKLMILSWIKNEYGEWMQLPHYTYDNKVFQLSYDTEGGGIATINVSRINSGTSPFSVGPEVHTFRFIPLTLQQVKEISNKGGKIDSIQPSEIEDLL
jgi:hypothetical protein